MLVNMHMYDTYVCIFLYVRTYLHFMLTQSEVDIFITPLGKMSVCTRKIGHVSVLLLFLCF